MFPISLRCCAAEAFDEDDGSTTMAYHRIEHSLLSATSQPTATCNRHIIERHDAIMDDLLCVHREG
jgi:hypothetical protein